MKKLTKRFKCLTVQSCKSFRLWMTALNKSGNCDLMAVDFTTCMGGCVL